MGALRRARPAAGRAWRALRGALAPVRFMRVPGGADPYVFAPELDVTYRPRRPSRPTLVQVSGGVIAAAGQNGHLELRVGRGNPPQLIAGAIATRNESADGGRIASGGQLTAIVAPGLSYCLVTHTVDGFERPQFVITTLLSETPL